METFSALLALCAGNSPVSGEFPAQMPVTRVFDVFFDLRCVNTREAGDLRRYPAHYDVIVMCGDNDFCVMTIYCSIILLSNSAGSYNYIRTGLDNLNIYFR